jgi:hypothetical protein
MSTGKLIPVYMVLQPRDSHFHGHCHENLKSYHSVTMCSPHLIILSGVHLSGNDVGYLVHLNFCFAFHCSTHPSHLCPPFFPYSVYVFLKGSKHYIFLSEFLVTVYYCFMIYP